MFFMALAVDYDGTLAYEGAVEPKTLDALIRLKESGRKLLLVTGRQLDELKQIFHRLDLFDYIVAENGALLYTPQTESQRLLAEPPSSEFAAKLKASGVSPVKEGRIIVATEEPQEMKVLEIVRNMGLDLEIIFNKGAVMVLPSGVNKATGLAAALEELGLTMYNVIGIGDGENDHAFLRVVGLGVAVANACESVKQSAGWVAKGAYGQGVEDIIDRLVEDEDVLISKVSPKITVGSDIQGVGVELIPIDRVLIAGNSGIGKSTLATALTEKMVANSLQFCIFDPEGDYETLENAIGVGEVKSPPSKKQVIEILQDPSLSVVVNTLGVELKERPAFFAELAPQLLSLKNSTGRPHWLIIDEAHHLMPSKGKLFVSVPMEGTILITVHPDALTADVLKSLNVIIILGPQAPQILKQVSQIIGEPLPGNVIKPPSADEVLIWMCTPRNEIKILKVDKPQQEHKRHTSKYAEGDLSDDFCFYFRGPKDEMNLKAQNLIVFLQIAEGIDDATWMHHLEKQDYSDWFRTRIKDDNLADVAAKIEVDRSLSAKESREAIANIVRKLYTAPASVKDN